jgi:beta-glucosidase
MSGSLGLTAALATGTAGATAAAPAAKRAVPTPGTFLWGTASSAHQIEGNNVNSDFWLAEHVKPTLFREPSGDACDSYHRYDEDAALAAGLGFNAHRFGIEWARIEPEPGRFSEAELDHYVRVLESCRRHGLAPMVTLSHWTVPRWFAARGGFETSDSPALFERFAAKVAERLGPLMSAATTFNECNIGRLARFLFALDTPQAKAGVKAMLDACAKATGSDRFANILIGDIAKSEPNLVEAHRRAVAALKAGPGEYPVGLTISMQAIEGVGSGNKAAAFTDFLYGPWLDAAAVCDFVGVQTYTRLLVGAEGRLPPPAGAETTGAGYEFYPQALGDTVRFAARRMGKPIYVTENGIATDDDTRRVAYIDGALAALRQAKADGVDVRGYFHWSLLDNFEWTAGYAQKFGLVTVDRKTFARTPKPSARHLGAIAKRRRSL